ncbi:MAG: hypothetical protein M1829_002864 [Trizodia sp. TS-e1964]|nr:MAG: hypothetical protein M1829_002864 [Trizodia sp. TS-e1964]
MSFPNIWHLRRVGVGASKACWICFKPTSEVLITPDNKDFFYICAGHLKDPGFCSPTVDEAAVAKKKKREEMEREIELLKRAYAEKQAKKEANAKQKDKDKDKDRDKDREKVEERRAGEAISKDKTGSEPDDPAALDEDAARIFALHKNFYQMRIDRLRNVEIARRNRDRLKNPTTFPSVPAGELE